MSNKITFTKRYITDGAWNVAVNGRLAGVYVVKAWDGWECRTIHDVLIGTGNTRLEAAEMGLSNV